MAATHSIRDLAARMAHAQSDIFPAEIPWNLLADIFPFPAFAVEHADHAIEVLERRRRAIASCDVRVWNGDGVDPFGSRYVWRQDRETRHPRLGGEAWTDFVARTAHEARVCVERGRALIALGADPKFIRIVFQWLGEKDQHRFRFPIWLEPIVTESANEGIDAWRPIRHADSGVGFPVRVAEGIAPGSFYGTALKEGLDTVPHDAEFLKLDGRNRDIAELPRLSSLTALHVVDGRAEALVPTIARLPMLRSLSLHGVHAATLQPLTALPHLEHLALESVRVPELGGLSALTGLETLKLSNVRGVSTLEAVAPLKNLRGLSVSGTMETLAKFPTLEPLGRLTQLRELYLEVSAADKSLRPLTRLEHLTSLFVSNYYPREEFAELAAADLAAVYPNNIVKKYRSMWWVSPDDHRHLGQIVHCKKCNEGAEGTTIGSPGRRFCERCDVAKIEKFRTTWESLIREAEQRRRMGPRA